MTSSSKPMPVPDALSSGFWEAAARHELMLQRCAACGHLTHPPDVVCVACLSSAAAFTFEPVSGRGCIRSWTIMRDTFLPAFRVDIPWVIVDVELREGPRMVARLVDGASAPLRIGLAVRVVFDDVADGVALPCFQLIEGADGAGTEDTS